jgi:Fic family protein
MPDLQERTPDVKEVDNNFRSLEFGLRTVTERGISQHLIRQMHQMLLEGVRGQDMTPGQYRRIQAHIGRSTNIKEARFVPPPPHLVQQCMNQLEHFMQEDQTTPRIARLAMTHYQFECIHPFADGNGRIGRVLILLLMCHWGMLPLPLFNPSAYLENNRRAYYDHLMDLSHKGSWPAWIEFFSRGITEECSNTSKRIETLEKLRKSYQEKVRISRAPANLTKLVDELFGQPRVTLEEVQEILRVWPTSAQRYIDKLVSLKIIREVTGGQRNRVYLAQRIVDVFSTET